MLRWSHFCSDRFRLPSNIFNWDTTSKRSAQVPKCPSYTYIDYVFKTSSRRLGKQEMFAGLSAWVSEYPSSALQVPKCPSAQVSKCSPSAQVPSNSLSAWLPSESPPSSQRSFRLVLTLTLNKKHSFEMRFKQIIIRF